MNIENIDPKGEEGEEREEEEQLFENFFANQFQSSSTSEESLHLNELFFELEYQDNPLALVIYQPSPLGNPQMVAPFRFPIPTQQGTQNLKNIPSVVLPKFYGLITEDLETFLFEFDVLFQSYNYTMDAHKLKLFPSTLKEVALRWFMSLGANIVQDRQTTRNLFLAKYKDYC